MGAVRHHAHRVAAEARAEVRSFLRQRTAVFFTFVFPLLVVGLFGAAVQATGGRGLFARPQGYYLPGYLAVVIVLTPLTRVGGSVARYADGRRFEKLVTTPLARVDWLLAHVLVNVLFVGLSCLLIVVGLLTVTGARVGSSPLVVGFVVLGIALFCCLGAILGSLADSEDGVVAASNGLGVPLIALSNTFVPVATFPPLVRPVVGVLPLTPFAHGIRLLTYGGTGSVALQLGLLGVWTVLAFVGAVVLLPWSA